MTSTIKMQSTDRLELGFGAVFEDKKEWMYQEYFPTFGPLMAHHGLRNLVSFRVVASNAEGVPPVQGALSSWPSAQHRRELHEDPTFAAILPTRDAAMHLSDGHLFEPLTDATLPTDGDVAIVVGPAETVEEEALLQTALASDSASRTYEGKVLSLLRWSDGCEQLLAKSPAEALVLRVRLAPDS